MLPAGNLKSSGVVMPIQISVEIAEAAGLHGRMTDPPREPTDLAHRVWFAYHCLPRRSRNRPPSYRSLELAHGLPLSTFSKLFAGLRQDVDRPTLLKLAQALDVTVDWLATGAGYPPTPRGPVPQLGAPEIAANRFDLHDRSAAQPFSSSEETLAALERCEFALDHALREADLYAGQHAVADLRDIITRLRGEQPLAAAAALMPPWADRPLETSRVVVRRQHAAALARAENLEPTAIDGVLSAPVLAGDDDRTVVDWFDEMVRADRLVARRGRHP